MTSKSFRKKQHQFISIMIFLQIGNLLKVEVAIGNVETVVKADKTRTVPSQGFDSIIVSFRLLPFAIEVHLHLYCLIYQILSELPLFSKYFLMKHIEYFKLLIKSKYLPIFNQLDLSRAMTKPT
jgi:hypothetical protein